MAAVKTTKNWWIGLVVILFVSAEFSAAQAPWTGGGDANDPYQILDANDVNVLGDDPNYYSAHFILMADVNMAGFSYAKAVIARGGSQSFTGVFDGDGYTITNLTIDTGGANNPYLGLFGKIDTGASIRNLGLVNLSITGGASSNYVGGLVGYNYRGDIANCYSKGSVSGNSNVGGLVGMNRESISQCYSVGAVRGSSQVGGLVGDNYTNGIISRSYSSCSVFGGRHSGGLAGRNYDGNISKCYATGPVSGTSDVGGLLGRNDSENPMERIVSQCYSTGGVFGDQFPGGLIGYSLGGYCNQSYWDKWTSGQTTSWGGTGKTTLEMQQQATYRGWDFVDSWFMVEDAIYPIHLWAASSYKGDLNLDGQVNFRDLAIMGLNWLE